MAITETVISQSAQMRLNDGTTTTGAVKTVNVSIGTLSDNPAAWDAQKAVNIIDKLAPLMDRVLHKVTRTATFELEEA